MSILESEAACLQGAIQETSPNKREDVLRPCLVSANVWPPRWGGIAVCRASALDREERFASYFQIGELTKKCHALKCEHNYISDNKTVSQR